MHNYHRFYDPTIGRYIQRDPSDASAGASTYGYVGGHPLAAGGPSGLEEEREESASGRVRKVKNGFKARTGA